MINWKVRIRNKTFWMTLIPAVLLLAQSIAQMLGCDLALETFGSRLTAVAEQLFALLAILGIVNDPTTHGFSDSEQAMGYEQPK